MEPKPSECAGCAGCPLCRFERCEFCGADRRHDDPAEHGSDACPGRGERGTGLRRARKPCGLCADCCSAAGRGGAAESGRACNDLAARILAAARAGLLEEAARLERLDVQLTEGSLCQTPAWPGDPATWPAVRAVRAALQEVLRGGDAELAWALALTSERVGAHGRYQHYSCLAEVLTAELARVSTLELEAGPAAGEAAAAAVFARLERPLTISWGGTLHYGAHLVGLLRRPGGGGGDAPRWLVGVARALVARGGAPPAYSLRVLQLKPEDVELASALLECPRLAAELARPELSRIGAEPPIAEALARRRRWTPLRAAWVGAVGAWSAR